MPSDASTDRRPVEQVSWEDCTAQLRLVLPTEAQWEYACRAGSTTRWSFGDDEGKLGEYAWYTANSGSQTHPVGEKKPNTWGLFDMHGNVSEWCGDAFESNFYAEPAATERDPENKAPSAAKRVNRGGSWGVSAEHHRSAIRDWDNSRSRLHGLGFRLAKAVTAR